MFSDTSPIKSEGPPLEDTNTIVTIIASPLVVDVPGISPRSNSILHTPQLVGAIPISIVEAVHGQRTRVLTITIAVELEDIAIGIIPESFGKVIGSARIRLAPITLV
jgi:hypothetical protein